MKSVYKILTVSIPIFVLYVIFSSGIVVNYERSTGPELSILIGRGGLKSKGKSFGINYYERAYTTYEFDTDYGFKSIGTSFAFYKIVDSRPTESSDNQSAAVLQIQTFYPILLVFFIILISALCYLWLVRFLSKKIFK